MYALISDRASYATREKFYVLRPFVSSSLPTLAALLRQTNPNWKAIFVLGSTSVKFSKRMQTILNIYGDARMSLLAEPLGVRVIRVLRFIYFFLVFFFLLLVGVMLLCMRVSVVVWP